MRFFTLLIESPNYLKKCNTAQTAESIGLMMPLATGKTEKTNTVTEAE
jgi:hypothetical protein